MPQAQQNKGKGRVATRGAPLGNKNALGNPGNWYPRTNFISLTLRKALFADGRFDDAEKSKLVRKLVSRWCQRALNGDVRSLAEILKRVEGRVTRRND